MKRVVITGGTGFVGRNLVQELALLGVEIYVVVRNKESNTEKINNIDNVHIIYCELENILNLPEFFQDKNIDTFYHLAWDGSAGALRADYSLQVKNIQYLLNTAKVAEMLGCKRFLAAGTITERIVAQSLELPMPSQNMMYAICKNSARQLLNIYSKSSDMECIWMQFSNIYGPEDLTGNLISYTLFELLQNNRPLFSKGEQFYDFIYITDLVKSMILLGTSKLRNDFYFLGNGSKQLLKDYLMTIPQVLGINANAIGIGERQEDGLQYYEEWFDISTLVEDTGFTPQITYVEGLLRTIEWLKERL